MKAKPKTKPKPKVKLPDPAMVLNAALALELGQARHRSDTYFGLIEKVLAQRDLWKEMFHEQSAQHSSAQGLLEGRLRELTIAFSKVLFLVNEYRRRHNEPELTVDNKLTDGSTVRKRFDEFVAELEKLGPKEFDAIEERDAIAAEDKDVEIEDFGGHDAGGHETDEVS